MKKILLLIPFLFCFGCASAKVIGRVNRILPMLEQMQVDQDWVNQKGGHASLTLDIKSKEDYDLLCAIARNTGWNVERYYPGRLTISYKK